MRVFPDTNVLVSAFATRGLCADLLGIVILEHDLVVGALVLHEMRRVLRQKLKLPPTQVRDIESFLREYETVRRPRRHLSLGLRDPDDEWIVASAVAGKVDVLVTGDADLLAAANGAPVRLLSPRECWEALRRR